MEEAARKPAVSVSAHAGATGVTTYTAIRSSRAFNALSLCGAAVSAATAVCGSVFTALLLLFVILALWCLRVAEESIVVIEEVGLQLTIRFATGRVEVRARQTVLASPMHRTSSVNASYTPSPHSCRPASSRRPPYAMPL